MGWDPIGDIRREVENAVSFVSNTFNREVQNAVNSFNENRAYFERSDLGRVTRVMSRPVTMPMEIGKKVAEGDLKGAANRTVGYAAASATAQTTDRIQMSSTLENVASTKEANNLTFGYSGDAVDVSRRSSELSGGRDVNINDVTSFARYGVKTAAGAYGLSKLASSGKGKAALDYAKSKPLETVTAASLLAKGKTTEAAAPFLNQIFPAPIADFIRDVFTPAPTPIQRGPAGEYSSGDMGGEYNAGFFGSQNVDPRMKIALVVFVAFAGILIARKFRK
jgi:hypothetical protein